jgi:hypothetical protein
VAPANEKKQTLDCLRPPTFFSIEQKTLFELPLATALREGGLRPPTELRAYLWPPTGMVQCKPPAAFGRPLPFQSMRGHLEIALETVL